MKITDRILAGLMVLCLFCILATSQCGCKSSPATTAVRVSDASRVTVEAALGAWDAYIVQNHPPLDQQLAVKDAWEKYQAAQLVVLDAALVLRTAQEEQTDTTTAKSLLTAAIAEGGQSLADLMALIRKFGVKL